MMCDALVPAETAAVNELRHRFRNSLQVMTSLVGLHARSVSDAKASRAFADLRSRMMIMTTIFTELDSHDGDGVALNAFLPQIAHQVASLQGTAARRPLRFDLVDASVAHARAAAIAQIMAEFLMATYRHEGSSSHEGAIDISLARENRDRLRLEVGGASDAGSGDCDEAAHYLLGTIVRSLASTLDATFHLPLHGVGTARLSFDAAPPP